MKLKSFAISLIIANFFYFSAQSAVPPHRQRLLMDYNWKFIQSDVKDAEKPNFDDAKWRTLNLPPDWSIEGEFKEDAITKGSGGFLPTGVGWYRKHFNLTQMKSSKRNTFNGLALAVIQSTRESGNIRLTAVSKDLKEAVLQVVTRKK